MNPRPPAYRILSGILLACMPVAALIAQLNGQPADRGNGAPAASPEPADSSAGQPGGAAEPPVSEAADKAQLRQEAKTAAETKRAGVTGISFEQPLTFPSDI